MPKSGKTTVCDIVVHLLKRSEYKVTEYHGGSRYSPIDKSALPGQNLHLALKAAEFLLLNVERERVQNRIFVMDRGLFDRRVFTRALLEMGAIDPAEAQVLFALLSLRRLIEHIDGVFLFITDPKLSIEREYVKKLLERPGRVMNGSFLEKLRDASLAEEQEWRELAKYVRTVDTTVENGRVLQCARLVADDILRLVGANQ